MPRTAILLVSAVVAGFSVPASAAVLAHWRFEDSPGRLLDSSGNNRTLTDPGSTASPTHVTLPAPGGGNGSAFSDPLPLTGAANAKASSFDGGDRLTRADEAAFTSTTFTIEAFINGSDFDTQVNNKSIAGHWSSTGNQRSYLFTAGAAASGASPLSLLYSHDGSTTNTVASTLTLSPNTDYFVAVTVNLADTSSSGITFYAQNLTSGGPLLTSGQTHTQTALFNAAVNFTIGSTDQPSSQFTGLIDEVRLSNTKLTAGELLIAPEPGSATLLVLGAAAFLSRRRRQA